MDWALAIDRNRDALLRLVALLFATMGIASNSAVETLPRHVRNRVLRLLRPAESAARRLIVIAARGVSLQPRPPCPAPVTIPRGNRDSLPAFPLFDARKRFTAGPSRPGAGAGPRIGIPGVSDPVFGDRALPCAGDPVRAQSVLRRLRSLKAALDDLPGQARRFARWQARRNRSSATGRVWPLRVGRPPGHRARPVHEVDTILGDCHVLALRALEPP